MNVTNVSLRQIERPDWSIPADEPQPTLPTAEYEQRLAELYATAGTTWVAVYADREHAANVVFLTHFDPRFEEALLLLGPNASRTLILGNEDMGYTSQARPEMAFVLCQSFSLMGQARDQAPRLDAVLRQVGLKAGDSIGVVGWKYLEASEDEDLTTPAFIPAYFLRHLQRVVGEQGRVTDVTHVLMHPTQGLKSRNSAAQIAMFEWAAMRTSEAVQRVLRHATPGQTEAEAALQFAYQGLPMSCHPMLNSAGAGEPVVGLRSPGMRKLDYGDGVSTAIGYWGSLCARAGLLRTDAPAGFVEGYVAPYFKAIATWYQTIRVGAIGGELFNRVLAAFEGSSIRPALNPGHLVSIDEWTHTPIRQDSGDAVLSGMALQCDIIPSPMPDGQALNCEDTVAIADAPLRADLAANYPAVWQRIQARRSFMQTALGLVLDESVLPLSNTPAYFAPCWLAPDLVCSVL